MSTPKSQKSDSGKESCRSIRVLTPQGHIVSCREIYHECLKLYLGCVGHSALPGEPRARVFVPCPEQAFVWFQAELCETSGAWSGWNGCLYISTAPVGRVGMIPLGSTELILFSFPLPSLISCSLLFFYSLIHMSIHCLGQFFPLLPNPSLSPNPLLLPGRTCSALVSNFVEDRTQIIRKTKCFC
jgi:hypothetical protein